MSDTTKKTRCEGYTRRGGALTLGRPQWVQCKNDATVLLTVKQEEVEEMPACMECWNTAKEHGIEIIKAEPIGQEDDPVKAYMQTDEYKQLTQQAMPKPIGQ